MFLRMRCNRGSRRQEAGSREGTKRPIIRARSRETRALRHSLLPASCLLLPASCSSGPRPVSIATADQGTLPGRSGFESAVAFEVVVVLELRTLADVVEDRAEHADRHAVEYLQLGLGELAIRFTGAEHDQHRARRHA